MIPDGTDAPTFELPALREGEHCRVALEEFLGEDIVVLAFYPGDFNPACDEESDLDELDLFRMQKDVTVLGIGPDSLYSHAAFADAYDLRVPLLADTDREVAEAYDVAFEDDVGQGLVERAVVVVDHDGLVQYAWSTRDLTELPPVERIKDAIVSTGGDDAAFARYRVGHAHYTEGRRSFTSAMEAFAESEWMLARSDFDRAREAFDEAADHFDSAVRFADDRSHEVHYERAGRKAKALWQATDWLTQSANAYSSGVGKKGRELRTDAERPLETARDLGEPVDPDDWPPEDRAHETGPTGGNEEGDLTIDVDEETDDATEAGSDRRNTGRIDDEELKEIEAELAATDDETEELEETPTSMVEAPPGADDGGEDPADGAAESAGGGDIDGTIGEDELAELAADMAASQAAAEEAGDPDADGDDDADSETGGDRGTGDAARPDDPPADPDADLAGGGQSERLDVEDTATEPGGSDGGRRAGDESADRDRPAETRGASDDDLAEIPTTDELEDGTAGGDESAYGSDGDPDEGDDDRAG